MQGFTSRLTAALAVALGLAVLAQDATPEATPEATAELLGTADDLVPTQDEINTAVSALGTDGFIGVIACTYTTDYHKTVADAAAARATELGLKVQEFDSDLNVDKQISAIENFTNSGAKVRLLTISPSHQVAQTSP